jgi:hypothetical protein
MARLTGDYKDDVQALADEIADREFGEDFFDLANDQRTAVFLRAEQDWIRQLRVWGILKSLRHF